MSKKASCIRFYLSKIIVVNSRGNLLANNHKVSIVLRTPRVANYSSFHSFRLCASFHFQTFITALPLQVFLLPTYPLLQLHVKEPPLLAHVALSLQLCVLAAHSSMSASSSGFRNLGA